MNSRVLRALCAPLLFFALTAAKPGPGLREMRPLYTAVPGDGKGWFLWNQPHNIPFKDLKPGMAYYDPNPEPGAWYRVLVRPKLVEDTKTGKLHFLVLAEEFEP